MSKIDRGITVRPEANLSLSPRKGVLVRRALPADSIPPQRRPVKSEIEKRTPIPQPDLAKLQANDRAEWTKWISNLQAPLLRVVQKQGVSRDDAEDIIQHVWISIITNIGNLTEEGNLNNYIVIAVLNRVKTFIRDQGRRRDKGELSEAVINRHIDPIDTHEVVSRGQQNEALRAILEELRPAHREALVYLAEGQSIKEVSTATGISERVARDRRRRAIAALQRRMQPPVPKPPREINEEEERAKTPGQLLRDFRNDHGISLRSLAQLAGVDKGTINLIEQGRTEVIQRPTYEKIVAAIRQITWAGENTTYLERRLESSILEVSPRRQRIYYRRKESEISAEEKEKWREVGELIRNFRMDNDLSLPDFAVLVGMGQSTLSLFENAKRRIGTPIIERLINAIEMVDTSDNPIKLDIESKLIELLNPKDPRSKKVKKAFENKLEERRFNQEENN